MKARILILILVGCGFTARAQFILFDNDKNKLELGGNITLYYRYSWPLSGFDLKNNSTFILKDARLDFSGKLGKKFDFEFKIDLAHLISQQTDPEDPAIAAAYFMYKPLKWLHIEAGFYKVPFSLSSLISFNYSPYFNRPLIAQGDLFSEHDLGISLRSSLWKDRINIYAGAYTGLGEYVLSRPADYSGTLEYMGRLELAWPSKPRYRMFDLSKDQPWGIMAGGNIRYTWKDMEKGNDFPIKIIEGEKYVYGFDVLAYYKGLSATFEMDQAMMIPDSLIYVNGTAFDYFRAGGWATTLTYQWNKARSIFSARYEEFNADDLNPGYFRRITGGYAFMLKKLNSLIRINYMYNISEEILPGEEGMGWDSRIMAGWQFRF